jgi:hypothetical protein
MSIADGVQFLVQSGPLVRPIRQGTCPFFERLAGSGDYAGRATERGLVFDREIGATKQ